MSIYFFPFLFDGAFERMYSLLFGTFLPFRDPLSARLPTFLCKSISFAHPCMTPAKPFPPFFVYFINNVRHHFTALCFLTVSALSPYFAHKSD